MVALSREFQSIAASRGSQTTAISYEHIKSNRMLHPAS